MKKAILACILASLSGWLAAPYILLNIPSGCVSNTTMVYDEPDKTVVSKSRWEILKGGEQSYYSSLLSVRPFTGVRSDISIERTINLDFKFHTDSYTVETTRAFRIAGPDTSDPAVGRYIDPPAEENFNARVYSYFTGGRVILGFRNLPIAVCSN